MATTPQPPHKPAAPPPQPPKPGGKDDKLHQHGDFKEGHAPLKDPNEGKSPAIYDPREREQDLGPGGPRPLGVKGDFIDDGERDPDTVAEEQRRRSAEIEAMGVEAWKDAHDERSEEEKRAHPTVVPERTPVEDTKRIENNKAP
jgi:hypothetical protein